MLLIDSCYRHNLIDNQRKEKCKTFIKSEKTHVEIRNLIMMILLPRKLHIDDNTQGAYLRAAVSRVRHKTSYFFSIIL